MKGTVKVKDDSNYIYAGATLKIIGIDCVHSKKDWDSPFKEGTVDYKLSLVGTEWESRSSSPKFAYTIIHESHLENFNIESESSLKSEIWWKVLGSGGHTLATLLWNKDGCQSIEDMYNSFIYQMNNPNPLMSELERLNKRN